MKTSYSSDTDYIIVEKTLGDIKVREYLPEKTKTEKIKFSENMARKIFNSNFFKTE